MTLRNEADVLIDEILAMSDGDDVRVSLGGRTRTHIRFANNQVTTSGIDEDNTVSVSVSYGSRTGTASGNQLDPESLKAVVASAQSLAKLAPEDPEFLPSLGPQPVMVVPSWADPDRPDALQQGCASVIGVAADRGLLAAGLATASQNWHASGTKGGFFAWYGSTRADISTTHRTPDGQGSGWATRTSLRPDDLDFQGLAKTAADKAETSVNRKPLKPGRYVTILEPACVANLMGLLAGALDQRRVDEGRSFMQASDLMQPRFPAWVHATSNPGDPRAPARPYTAEGLAQMRRIWIRNGALFSLPVSRFWAKKIGQSPVPGPSNWIMSGGEGTVDDLVAKTERGVLVTSLWYIRGVDPRRMMYTGLTRDGIYWIEEGKISHPLTNMRWNDSPLNVLEGAIDASAPVVTRGRTGRGGPKVVPAIRTKAFHFSSVSDAV
jgi:predicted Zn-dependent protease